MDKESGKDNLDSVMEADPFADKVMLTGMNSLLMLMRLFIIQKIQLPLFSQAL